jgi:purine nucleoside phosphorylase
MVRTLGGDLVGMSTTLEAIAAREAGAECSASPWSPTWRPA